MATRTYTFTITGTITVDEADLRASYLALPIRSQVDNPTAEQEAEESMQTLGHAQAETPERLVEQLLTAALLVHARAMIRPAKHSFPKVDVVLRDE